MTTTNRWDAFTTSELENITGAFSVADQEYGVADDALWQGIRDELLRREFPDPIERRKMLDWSAAIAEHHRRFPTPLERILRTYYESALTASFNRSTLAWLESDA